MGGQIDEPGRRWWEGRPGALIRSREYRGLLVVAALATIFGSPVVRAVILIEAAGLGGPTLPLVLLPGLMSAGIGSLIFIGMGTWTGLSSSDYALHPFTLPAYSSPTLADFGWTVVLAVVAALVALGIVEMARASAGQVGRKPWLLIPAAGLVVAGLAIGFAQITGQSADVVLFSGENAFSSMFSETPAVAALMGAMAVSILRLPLSSVVLALLLTSSTGIATAPIVIVAVVVAYITVESVSAARSSIPDPAPRGSPARGESSSQRAGKHDRQPDLREGPCSNAYLSAAP